MEIKFSAAAIQLNPHDPLAISKQEIAQDTILLADQPALPFQRLVMLQTIPAGHKFALQKIAMGNEVLRYGCRIGAATRDILPGEWIHTHNLAVGDLSRDFTIQVVKPQAPAAPKNDLHFMGYARAGNRFGTRNYIAVVSTVNCSAQTVRAIAQAFAGEQLADYPHVDGVVAVTHSFGCSGPIGDLSYRYLQRTLLNLARHPNIGGILFVSLGCEVNQMAELVSSARAKAAEKDAASAVIAPFLTIQDEGGIVKTTAAGIKAVREMLPQVNDVSRVPVPLSGLAVALQCGGSDGWSGVTANPLVGRAADEIVYRGGSVVLAETPEIYGAEQLLSCRASSEQVGQKLIERIKGWQAQAELLGFSLDNNPSPGNKAGGLTTIYEKSLGAVAKGGTTPLMDVVEYAEWVTAKGLVFMDTPGNDPVSVTGQVAGGCNLVLFTTGRGSVFGGNLAPCIKIASNSTTYQRMSADMDYNAGAILEGKTFEKATGELLEMIISVASGAPAKSEFCRLREAEFIPWHIGALL